MATLIIGATGLLGRALHHRFAPHGALGTCHARARPGLLALDVRDPQAIDALLRHLRPDMVINAAGERRPAVWEREPGGTRAVNVDAAAEIARAATRVGAWLIHISTDYVFDGTAAPYTPTTDPAPSTTTEPANSPLNAPFVPPLPLRPSCASRSCMDRSRHPASGWSPRLPMPSHKGGR
jgi:dTDP-4-dehydrorhamnose reductase